MNTAVSYNTGFNRGEDGVNPEDFMPSLFRVNDEVDDVAALSSAFQDLMKHQAAHVARTQPQLTKPKRKRKSR